VTHRIISVLTLNLAKFTEIDRFRPFSGQDSDMADQGGRAQLMIEFDDGKAPLVGRLYGSRGRTLTIEGRTVSCAHAHTRILHLETCRSFRMGVPYRRKYTVGLLLLLLLH
jgi:hypothetical protein